MTEVSPHIELVRRVYRAFGQFDLATLEQLFAEEVEMVQVGRNRLAGTFHGRDQLFGHFADIGRETSAMEMEPVELLGSDGRVAALNRMTVEIGGHSREFRVIHVFRIVDGRIVELYSVPTDPYELDAFFG